MIRRDTLRNRALEIAIVVIVLYGIAFYVFDPPDWLKVVAGIALAGAWLFLYVAAPAMRAAKRRRLKGHS
jgi:multisubunit Na+/H+ antiporter MnhC subunit